MAPSAGAVLYNSGLARDVGVGSERRRGAFTLYAPCSRSTTQAFALSSEFPFPMRSSSHAFVSVFLRLDYPPRAPAPLLLPQQPSFSFPAFLLVLFFYTFNF